MTTFKELSKEDLMIKVPNMPNFQTTEDIQPYINIIGQKKAVESIDLGLEMDNKYYNIYISGHSSTGKTSYIVRKIEEYAKNLEEPKDWCYVNNFKDEKRPITLELPTETGNKFKLAMDGFVKKLQNQAPAVFSDKSYEKEKNTIINKYQKQIINTTNDLNLKAKELNFLVKQGQQQEFIFIPLDGEKEMEAAVYEALSAEEKDSINERLNDLKLISFEINKEIIEINKKLNEEMDSLDEKLTENIIGDDLAKILKDFGESKQLEKYLYDMKIHIIENIGYFVDSEQEENSAEAKLVEEFFKKFYVNIVVSNLKGSGAPVIYEDFPDYNNIFGKIEFDNIKGNLVTNFSKIRAGSIHKANGGFLIMNAQKLFSNAQCWEPLKQAIMKEKINIEFVSNNVVMVPISSLKPEGIPLKIKVILVGSNYVYSALQANDPEFSKLFKIKAEFDYQIENDQENIMHILGFYSEYIRKNKICPISRDGMEEILRYSSKQVNHQKYFTAQMSTMLQIIDMSCVYTRKTGKKIIEREDIKKAITKYHQMHDLYRQKTLDMYRNKIYIVDLSGFQVGQINGLSVMDYGDAVVGKQHRITVATYAGRAGIVNIERETDMSGNIHSKGVMILSGFIGELVGQELPISFNASIVFEQLYSGIEGDSASAAELLALISSLSRIPINQSMAITGSVNQKGEIQPIGGVNAKIEGYFDICSIDGLNGSHGVVIPNSNINDLVLDDKVVDAVEKGLFHIYAVETIEQCMEIMFKPHFKLDSKGTMQTVKEKMILKLEKYNKILSRK
ncbi:Lon protease family protein [Clostridium grantii]|uniref:endopeptidase La n=1 Tax=Clostridium grantii DSM 8605 TaxID=1121316 RepID=A0A1M5RF38_9CLOT|nr:ATP-binding protein [Clostridium grantii]SHH24881.1 lon-related putative ATP-dependent protease [Clostridium grantii DSM 8605]